MNARFAKAYVDGDVQHARMLDVIADAVDGDVDGWTVEAGGIEIDVRPNEDCRSRQHNTDPDDFVFFPFTLDIETVDEAADLDEFLRVISSVMRRLHSDGMRIVVACDWESQLPGGGRLGF
jgi:hypothetical protein